jgi:polysaccharide chain length determinant protein (PEP-CTERM system associated)
MWRRRKWVALLVFAAVFAVVASLIIWLPDVYRAAATVLVERQQVSEAFVRPSVTAELETRIQTIRQEIMSRARLADLITRFDLYPDLREKRAPIDVMVEQMRRDIQLDLNGVEPLGGRTATIAFTVSYTGREPQTVAQVANTLASFYVEENTKTRERQATQTAEFLKAQLAGVKKELDDQDGRANDFKLRHIGELPQQVETNLASLERLNTQVRLNGENQIRAMDRRESIEKQLAEADPAATSVQTPAAAQLAKLRLDLSTLRRRFTDDYPDVVRARLEIASLEEQVAESARSANSTATLTDQTRSRLRQNLKDVDAEIASLKEEERTLRQDMGGYEQRVESAPKRQQELQELSRDYETTKERYDTLSKRYEEAQLAESLEQGPNVEQFRILDPALPPRSTAAPNRVRLLLVGFMLSLGLAAGAMLAAERLDATFHSVADLRAFATIPILVSIPMIATATAARKRRYRLAWTAVSVVAGLALIVAGAHHVATGNDQIVRLMARVHL